MTTQYNVPIKVLDKEQEYRIQSSLQKYKIFTDEHGNLEKTCFSKENFPYLGQLVVVKTLKQKAAKIAYDVLSGIEGLSVMPITKCSWEEDVERIKNLN